MFDERIALGLPSLAGYTLSGALDAAASLGFQSVMSLPDGPRAEHSLGAFPTFSFYERDGQRKRELSCLLARFRRVAIHQAWDEQWEKWLDCAVCSGASHLTAHSGRPRDGQASPAFIAERAMFLRRLGDRAGQHRVRVGIENEGGRVEDYLALVEAAAHPFVGATLDLGHCAYFDHVMALKGTAARVAALNETLRSLVEALEGRIFSIHAHDVRESDWRDHRCVGTGVIDFPALFAGLRGAGFNGLVEIELEEPEKETMAAVTGRRLHELCQMLAPVTSP